MRDGGAYGCAVPRAYANLNPGLTDTHASSLTKAVKPITVIKTVNAAGETTS